MNNNCAVIFGGMGFVGSFFSKELSTLRKYKKIYLLDIHSKYNNLFRSKLLQNCKNIEFIEADVRKTVKFQPNEDVDLICNFAAVHREPGHNHNEYYETNILGANNVCDWAEKVKCDKIIFTSSISPYEPNNEIKDEDSIPAPYSPYGGSKLAAEKIHEIWQAKETNIRKLVIVRPGVVFGPSEGGNVSRLIKAIKSRYFVFMSNRKVIKAGIYVKELCSAMLWALEKVEKDISQGNKILFNATMNPAPCLEDYVKLIKEINNINTPTMNVPQIIILMPFIPINFFLNFLGINHPFDPVRIRKVSLSNNIYPKYLIENEYSFKYSLSDALKDWKAEEPQEW